MSQSSNLPIYFLRRSSVLICIRLSLHVLQDTKSIQFHASKLKLGQITLTSTSLNQTFAPDSTSVKFYDKQERVTLDLTQTILAGTRGELKIDFSEDLTGSMMGYYRSRFEQDGKEAYYALTQFQVRLSSRTPLMAIDVL